MALVLDVNPEILDLPLPISSKEKNGYRQKRYDSRTGLRCAILVTVHQGSQTVAIPMNCKHSPVLQVGAVARSELLTRYSLTMHASQIVPR